MTTYRLRMKSFARAPKPTPIPTAGRFANWTGMGKGGNFDLAFNSDYKLDGWTRAGEAAKGTAKLAAIGGTVYGASSAASGIKDSFTGKSGNNKETK